MFKSRGKFLRRPGYSLGPVALLALVPKCGVCVLAYLGLGTILGLRGPEICGAPAGPADSWMTYRTAVALALGWIGLITALRIGRNLRQPGGPVGPGRA